MCLSKCISLPYDNFTFLLHRWSTGFSSFSPTLDRRYLSFRSNISSHNTQTQKLAVFGELILLLSTVFVKRLDMLRSGGFVLNSPNLTVHLNKKLQKSTLVKCKLKKDNTHTTLLTSIGNARWNAQTLEIQLMALHKSCNTKYTVSYEQESSMMT